MPVLPCRRSAPCPSAVGTLNFSTGTSVTITTLKLTGGTLTGTDTITVSGVTTWSSPSNLTGSGTLIAQGGLNISSPSGSGSDTLNTRTLENTGTATFTGSGSLEMVSATIINEPGATWNLETAGLAANGGSDTFNNEGTLNTTGSSAIIVTFTNSGTVAVNSATLTLGDGGSSSAGSFTVPTGSTLDFDSSYALSGTTQVSGLGSVTLAAGTLTLASGVIYDVTGGLTGSGGSATFRVGRYLRPQHRSDQWRHDRLRCRHHPANAWARVCQQRHAELQHGIERHDHHAQPAEWHSDRHGYHHGQWRDDLVKPEQPDRRRHAHRARGAEYQRRVGVAPSRSTLALWRTSGTATFTGSDSLEMQSATIINEPGATWNLETAGVAANGGSDTFSNEGMLDSTGTSTIGVTFNNTGTVNVPSGTLSLTGTISQFSGGTLTGGTWEASGGTLRGFSSGITTDAASIIASGAASNFYTGTSGTTNALTTLTGITSAGSLTLQNGFSLAIQCLSRAPGL